MGDKVDFRVLAFNEVALFATRRMRYSPDADDAEVVLNGCAAFGGFQLITCR